MPDRDRTDHPVHRGYGTGVIGLFLTLLGMDTGTPWLYVLGVAVIAWGTYTAITRD